MVGEEGGAGRWRKALLLLRGKGRLVSIRSLEAAVDGWNVLRSPNVAEALD